MGPLRAGAAVRPGVLRVRWGSGVYWMLAGTWDAMSSRGSEADLP